ncbi:MAG: ATP-dependent helicase [Bacilli bacterium]
MLRITIHGRTQMVDSVSLWDRRRQWDDGKLEPLWREGAKIECLCVRPSVAMHVRRYGDPPRYCFVDNAHQQVNHAPGCLQTRLKVAHTEVLFTLVDRERERSPHRPPTQPAAPTHHESTPRKELSGVPKIEDLSEQQQEAATHREGPCIVLAAAGSGKTSMVLSRVRHLIEQGVPASGIAAVTFTKKAAQEMKTRLEQETKQASTVFVGTMHSMAYRMVMSERPGWKILTDPAAVIERILQSPVDPSRHRLGPVMALSDAVRQVAAAKAAGQDVSDLEDPLRAIYLAYEAIKMESKRLDFEDLMQLAVTRFRENDAFAAKWRSTWRYVMVDEFQDTNPVQWLFLQELVRDTHNLLVVGDDYQSIYGFRGASPNIMRAFTRVYPQAQRVVLTQNYRSHNLIVDLSNRVMALNRGKQIDKRVIAGRTASAESLLDLIELESDTHEAEWVANEIDVMHKRRPEMPYHEYAVLYRTNNQSRVYEEALADRNVPYQVVGDRHFYESENVQTLLRYLRTAVDTSDASVWGPILNRPFRFLSRDKIDALVKEGWPACVREPFCKSLVHVMHQLQEVQEVQKPGEALEKLVDELPDLVRQPDDEGAVRWIDSLIASARRFDTIPAFLRFVDWVIEKSKEPKEDAVQLMTIHKSKGLEFETVFLTGLVEGVLPHKNAIEEGGVDEETRLCYVAMTRAKENLVLLAAKRYGDTVLPMSRYVQVARE